MTFTLFWGKWVHFVIYCNVDKAPKQLDMIRGMLMTSRKGNSLIQVLIVIAILAILIGLLLPAIQRIRWAASQMQSMNNLRQINVAVQNYASQHDEGIPGVNPPPGPKVYSLFVTILPYIEQGNVYQEIKHAAATGPTNNYVKAYISPSDPTVRETDKRHGPASYGANYWAFRRGGMSLSASFQDGTSNTLAFSEHYYRCGPQQVTFMYQWFGIFPGTGRPATFADPNEGDPKPITEGSPPTTHASFPTFPNIPTFQVAPTQLNCLHLVPQTPHQNGMLVALMDGSARVMSPSISPATYWGAITPSGGEVLGDW